MKLNFAAPCLFGLESLVADELRQMGAEAVTADNGRVFFAGDEALLARANICSRFAERILVVLGSFEAHTFEDLFQGVKNLPLENWIGVQDEFPVKGYSLKSDLFSVRDCQAIIKKAAVERLKGVYGVEWFQETGTRYRLDFSILKNQVHIFLDTTGVPLHKRGYRPTANDAPMRETLAAALCALSRLRPYHTLYDPMCGSGTILIEGAMRRGSSVRLRRSAFCKFPGKFGLQNAKKQRQRLQTPLILSLTGRIPTVRRSKPRAKMPCAQACPTKLCSNTAMSAASSPRPSAARW